MLPRWHILSGVLFTILIWAVAPKISFVYLSLIFFASFLIDFDHYINAVLKTGKLSLIEAFEYYKKREKELDEYERKYKKRVRGDFHLFHTLEFQLLVGIIGIFLLPLFYLFIGMVFHSLLDLIGLAKAGKLHRREYFLFNFLRKRC